jgi:DNA helicase-2/ATP-dependent DNA helicase PcrA
MRFFERAHVKDALAFLRVVANSRDEISWQRTLRLASGIGAETAAIISEVVRQTGSLEDALACDLSLPPRSARGFAEIAAILRLLLKAGSSPAAAIRALIGSGYAEYLEAEYQNAAERCEDLEELARFAEAFDSVAGFVSEASLQEGFIAAEASAAAPAKERMVLSTIHQAKGLEWDAVFIMHLSESSFPNSRALLEEGGEEEERRLFYVAVTRARRELYLTYPRIGAVGGAYLSEPSRFLSEIPDECLADGDEPEEWATIEVGEDGESRPRKGFLREIDEL